MPRQAGVLLPLFSIRSARDWGVGEIPDLLPLARWCAGAGFSIAQVLPVNEASRGQQKLAAAALILGQVAVETLSRPPRSVLVVDDPAAELDGQSLDRLLGAIDDLPAQQIFTALTPAQIAPKPNQPVFHVERGGVRAI